MFSGLKIYFAGVLVSFLGSLPLGTLNVTAMQIAIQETIRRAFAFAVGVALVELIYVRLSLKGLDFILANKIIFHTLEWVTVLLFAILGIHSFYAASRSGGEQKNLLLQNSVNRFWLGISMSAVNPAQVPFWFLWSSYLFSIRLLESTSFAFNMYTLGIATGTISGLLLFIYGGKRLSIRLNTSQKLLNIIVGIVFLVSSIIQLVRVLQQPLENRLK